MFNRDLQKVFDCSKDCEGLCLYLVQNTIQETVEYLKTS